MIFATHIFISALSLWTNWKFYARFQDKNLKEQLSSLCLWMCDYFGQSRIVIGREFQNNYLNNFIQHHRNVENIKFDLSHKFPSTKKSFCWDYSTSLLQFLQFLFNNSRYSDIINFNDTFAIYWHLIEYLRMKVVCSLLLWVVARKEIMKSYETLPP